VCGLWSVCVSFSFWFHFYDYLPGAAGAIKPFKEAIRVRTHSECGTIKNDETPLVNKQTNKDGGDEETLSIVFA
jgi:hypothetical protein